MNFSDYLKEVKSSRGIRTTTGLFEHFGGEENLGISLRHFQLIETGKRAPTEKLLALLFERVPASQKKTVVLAYFRSVLEGRSQSQGILDYLEQHLTPAIETSKRSIWVEKRVAVYSDEQLSYLTQNSDAMRFYKRVLVYDKSKKSDVTVSPQKLRQLINLNLLEEKKNEIVATQTLYRIPSYSNSNPRSVALGTEFILKHLDIYVSREGSVDQELCSAQQLVSPEVARRVIDQLQAFKKWVQSLAVSSPTTDSVPLVFVGFAKRLGNKEI